MNNQNDLCTKVAPPQNPPKAKPKNDDITNIISLLANLDDDDLLINPGE